jgi:hypothetical protein
MRSKADVDWIMDYVYACAKDFSIDYNVAFRFRHSIEVGRGGTSRFENQISSDILNNLNDGVSRNGLIVWCKRSSSEARYPDYIISLGLDGLLNNDSIDRETCLALMLSSMMHELRHVEQYEAGKDIHNRPDDMRPEVLWSLVATCGNPRIRERNYSYWPHEIDAERVGILSAYAELCDEFDVRSARVAMSKSMQYVTESGIGPVRYDDCPVEFDEDWFNHRMDKAMDLAKRHKRDIMSFVNGGYRDFAAIYLSMNDEDRKEFVSLTSFNPLNWKVNRGCDQDIYLAKININFRDKDRDFFDRMSLSFPRGFPEPSGGITKKSVVVQPVDQDHILIGDIDFESLGEQENSEDMEFS